MIYQYQIRERPGVVRQQAIVWPNIDQVYDALCLH